MAFIDQLWRDWSPGYDAAEHLVRVKESLRQSANLNAAIAYYQATGIGPRGKMPDRTRCRNRPRGGGPSGQRFTCTAAAMAASARAW
jgi:hypothetical protein